MALRAAKVIGEQCSQLYAQLTAIFGTGRQFHSARFLQADDLSEAVKGPGGGGSISGTKDMNVGERESVTEGAEGPKDVADSMKQHDDAGQTDSTGDLNRKPVGNADKQQVREDIAGSSP